MEKLLKRVYNSPKISASLKVISHASVIISVISYLALLVSFWFSDPFSAIRLAFAGGVPFVLVSIVRVLINAPRPYELYGFYTALPKQKRGRSFPSRHVFSAFLVAGLAFMTSPLLSIALATVGICLAVARVLLGIHFVRDVVAGALIGILSAVLGIIILF